MNVRRKPKLLDVSRQCGHWVKESGSSLLLLVGTQHRLMGSSLENRSDLS